MSQLCSPACLHCRTTEIIEHVLALGHSLNPISSLSNSILAWNLCCVANICYTALSQTLLTDISRLAVWNSSMLLCLFACVCLLGDRLQRANGWVFLAVCWLVLRKRGPFLTPHHPTYYGIFKILKSQLAGLVQTSSKFTLFPLCWRSAMVTFWCMQRVPEFHRKNSTKNDLFSSRQSSI